MGEMSRVRENCSRSHMGRFHAAESGKYQGDASIFWLHCEKACDIIRHRKQKCGGSRVLAHPQACTGEDTTYTTVPTASAGNIIRHFTLFCKGWSCRICPREHFLSGGRRNSHCAGLLRAVFLFSPGSPGTRVSGEAEGSCAATVFHGALPESGRNGNDVRSSCWNYVRRDRRPAL